MFTKPYDSNSHIYSYLVGVSIIVHFLSPLYTLFVHKGNHAYEHWAPNSNILQIPPFGVWKCIYKKIGEFALELKVSVKKTQTTVFPSHIVKSSFLAS